MKKTLFLLLTTVWAMGLWAAEMPEDSIYNATTEQAHYAEGDAALMFQLADRLLQEDVVVPESGRTVMKAVVEKNGSLSGCTVVASCGMTNVDTAAMNAVSQLPPFVPGKNGDDVVRSYIYIPVFYPSISKIMQKITDARAKEQKEVRYFRIDKCKYLVGRKNDTVAVAVLFASSGQAEATHFSRNVSEKDTMRLQFVSLTTNMVTAEDIRIKGLFVSNRIYDEAGNLVYLATPIKDGNGMKIRHYQAGQKVREYAVQLNGQTSATYYGGNSEVIAKHAFKIKMTQEELETLIEIEKLPQFPGGETALFRYLSENVKYPEVARMCSIQGQVICQFVVDKDGSICDVEVLHSGGDASLDKEAVRVIKSMPKWLPAKLRGKAVRVKYTVPVSFRLQ